ncbi:MAG: hypothetical protein B5766_04895 [Candidatus Lumbricidophila eiseniae]|uniref:Uncharacterized protein n=1 Tax=Candidatus Lumbricidiphila eiseniae TaxID=1969409 RepID=A0A2A6FSG0_9MICO|nr:MAG: hypothetical protein B5766_04895 [Candidatus Lumbricidophila eiseniae]
MKNTSNTPFGYTGTGSLSATWAGIKCIAAGNVWSMFTYNGIKTTLNSNVSANLTSVLNVTRISRGVA